MLRSMNKAGKHIQTATNAGTPALPTTSLLQSGEMLQKNVITSIMSFLPDNRPITSLHIVEDYEK